MSTSLLVESMLEEARRQGKTYHIWTVDQGIVENEINKCDVLLLGPQVRHMLKRIQKMVDGKIPVEIIRTQDYGNFDGAKVLAYAESLVANHKPE